MDNSVDNVENSFDTPERINEPALCLKRPETGAAPRFFRVALCILCIKYENRKMVDVDKSGGQKVHTFLT